MTLLIKPSHLNTPTVVVQLAADEGYLFTNPTTIESTNFKDGNLHHTATKQILMNSDNPTPELIARRTQSQP